MKIYCIYRKGDEGFFSSIDCFLESFKEAEARDKRFDELNDESWFGSSSYMKYDGEIKKI